MVRGIFVSLILLGVWVLVSCDSIRTTAAELCPPVEFGAFTSHTSNGARPVTDSKGKTIFLEQPPIFRLQDISFLGQNSGATTQRAAKCQG